MPDIAPDSDTPTRCRPQVVVADPAHPDPLATILADQLGIPLAAPSTASVDAHSPHEVALSQLASSERTRQNPGQLNNTPQTAFIA